MSDNTKDTHNTHTDSEEVIAQKKAKFLDLLKSDQVAGNVSYACQIMGVSREAMYGLRSRDPQFRAEWQKAKYHGEEYMSDRAENRLLALINQNNLGAIIFTLKNRRPDRWKSDKMLFFGDGGMAGGEGGDLHLHFHKQGDLASHLVKLHGPEKAKQIGNEIAGYLCIDVPGGEANTRPESDV